MTKGLCPSCSEVVFTTDIGKCQACGQATRSSAFSLCKRCAHRTSTCSACGKGLERGEVEIFEDDKDAVSPKRKLAKG